MKRIDKYLVDNDYFPSRKSAQAAIMAGLISIDYKVINKPSYMVAEDVEVTVKEVSHYVSRGAKKLLKALDEFQISVEDKTAIDVGASTGGFTQVLLERGVSKVIAVDVGYGQFHYKLRNLKKVVLFERTNVRNMDPTLIEPVDIATVDVSFISIAKIIKNLLLMLKDKAQIIILIKPQFEAERKEIKKGVVKDKRAHKSVINKVIDIMDDVGLKVHGISYSPITGPKGNIEFLLYLRSDKEGFGKEEIKKVVNKVVDEAHKKLL